MAILAEDLQQIHAAVFELENLIEEAHAANHSKFPKRL
jgi:hypothetical protein